MKEMSASRASLSLLDTSSVSRSAGDNDSRLMSESSSNSGGLLGGGGGGGGGGHSKVQMYKSYDSLDVSDQFIF